MSTHKNNSGITAPKGFSAAGRHVGIKKNGKNDLTLVACECPATAAGAFTKNLVHAAPVAWDRNVIKAGGMVRGILVNSGNANACTGKQGMTDCLEAAKTYAGLLKCSPEEILICSTGVIGVNLPMERLLSGIKETFPLLGSGINHDEDAVAGIMTTDTYPKTVSMTIELSGKTVTLGGMAKGSGMIHPNMATLLAFVTTDAAVSGAMLQKVLEDSVEETYNMISVDGDTSTNDTVLCLANGLAGNKEISAEDEDYRVFRDALYEINKKLAIEIAKDGEGATKLLEATVSGAKTKGDARLIARSVISSNLMKAAMFGNDANWGRVLCAMGYSGGLFDPAGVEMSFNSAAGSILLMSGGEPVPFEEEKALAILKEKEIKILIELTDGSERATAWGCDLTYDYVKINGDYRS